jgi:hypothetical protein
MSRSPCLPSWLRAAHNLAALALLVSGCATHLPQVLTPQISPRTFSGQVIESNQEWPKPDWWRTFGSPELSDLIEKAHADNRDLSADQRPGAGAALAIRAKWTVDKRAVLLGRQFLRLNFRSELRTRFMGTGTQ